MYMYITWAPEISAMRLASSFRSANSSCDCFNSISMCTLYVCVRCNSKASKLSMLVPAIA